jgi:hypothetical protein
MPYEPRTRKNYIKALHSYLVQHHVLERLEVIKALPDHAATAEQVDQDITRTTLHAELQCKSFSRLPLSADHDSILPSVSSIVARSYRLHSNIASIQGDMLQHAV